jgi:hypothetical protein
MTFLGTSINYIDRADLPVAVPPDLVDQRRCLRRANRGRPAASTVRAVDAQDRIRRATRFSEASTPTARGTQDI